MFSSGDRDHRPLQSVENKLDLVGPGRTAKSMNGLNNSTGCGFATKIRNEPFADTYTVEDEIGRGKFASVKRCKNKHNGHEYAAKFLRKRRKGKDCRHEVLHEISMLEMARVHPRLVDLVEVFETTNELILVTEYAAGGELHQCVCMEDGLEERSVVRIMRQVLEGLVFLHDRNVVHLDVKPQNILLTKSFPQGNIKLCDFGFARKINSQDDIRDIIGTPDYVAPEVLSYEPIHTTCDMWSVGVLAYVLLTGYSPFAGDTKQETFLNISQVNLDFPDDLFTGISLEAQDFISKLLVKEPSERMTARDCSKHAWLQDKETTTPLRSPFGSPSGCRRALTPPSSDGSLELEPSKKCKCEESDSKEQDKAQQTSGLVPTEDLSSSTKEDLHNNTTVENSRGTVIICNGSVCTTDTMIQNPEGSLSSRDTLDCEDPVCVKENACLSQISTIEQQLVY